MIGLDTNVLLRIFIRDEPEEQHVRSMDLLREAHPEPALINPIVLAEATWTLSKRMKRSREEVAGFVADVLDAEVFEVSSAKAARRALEAFANGRADYADYLIAEMNGDAGCRSTFTFDADAATYPLYDMVPGRLA